MEAPYVFSRDALAELLIRTYYPEKTGRESGIIRDWITAHGAEYDRFAFSVRVGQGQIPDPTHLPGIQRTTSRSSRKRIDILAWQGPRPTIVEVKERVTTSVLGQLQAYRQLFLEENEGAEEPRLVAIGRYSDEDTLRVLAAQGIDVYLYNPEQRGG
jgi:hypothetical protein